MEPFKRGGKRNGAGRKPADNPKKQITLYVPEKSIWPFGNQEKLKTALYNFIEGKKLVPDPVEVIIQDLTQSTHQIKPQETPKTNFMVNTMPAEPKLNLSEYEFYKAEILKCRTIPEVQSIVSKIKGGLMFPKEKQQLELIAKEHSKTMYND